MRSRIALVILAAVVAGGITVLSVTPFNDVVESTVLWTRSENGRNLLTVMIAITGMIGWGWAFRLWQRRRDTARQIKVLEEKLLTLQQRHVTLRQRLEDLPNMMSRVFVPCFRFLMRSLIGKLPARDQQGIVGSLQGAMEGDRGAPSLVPSQFAPPMRFQGRLPFGVPKQGALNESASITDLPEQESASTVKLSAEEQALFDDQIGQIIRQGIDRSLRGIGLRSHEVEHL
jgi:hypothetical protein